MAWFPTFRRQLRSAAADLLSGFMMSTHSSLAMFGMLVFVSFLVFSIQPQWREDTQARLLSWLQIQHYSRLHPFSEDNALERATVANPKDLPRQQALLVKWLSRQYRVAPEPLSAVVTEVFELAPKNHIDPVLAIALMAVESGFNPYVQGPKGQQGLMQVEPEWGQARSRAYGGPIALFDPITNVRVGLGLLREQLSQNESVFQALKAYALETHLPDEAAQANRVLALYRRLMQVSTGHKQVAEPERVYQSATVTVQVESLGERLWRSALVFLGLGTDDNEFDLVPAETPAPADTPAATPAATQPNPVAGPQAPSTD